MQSQSSIKMLAGWVLPVLFQDGDHFSYSIILPTNKCSLVTLPCSAAGSPGDTGTAQSNWVAVLSMCILEQLNQRLRAQPVT
jgi:hypothetical protein